jgi:hypothetical protein
MKYTRTWIWTSSSARAAPANHGTGYSPQLSSCLRVWAADNNKCCLWAPHNHVPCKWAGACRFQGVLRTTLHVSCDCTARNNKMPGIRLSSSLTYLLQSSYNWPHYSLMQPTLPQQTCLKSDAFSCVHGLHTTQNLCCGLFPAMCLAQANLSEVRRIFLRAWAAHNKEFVRWTPPSNLPCPSKPV